MNNSNFGKVAKVRKTAEKLQQLRDELNALFPEREHVVEQYIYGLATGYHLLIHGPYGTGKSLLVSTGFGAITDASKFSIALTKFMTESNIIGIPNPKVMRESGRIHYDTEGGILRAKLAWLDEIFDANAPVLRTLLGVLNERIFMRGNQVETAELHTAVAATNGDPDQEVKNAPELGAVADRLLFQSKVDYLKQQESRLLMYKNSMKGMKTSVRIGFDEIKKLKDLVCSIDPTDDEEFLLAFDTAVQEFRDKVQRKSRPISDRRACQLLNVMAASAVLGGRDYVTFNDLHALRWGLCMGGDEDEHTVFDEVLESVIDRAKRKVLRRLNDFQLTPSYRSIENIPHNDFRDLEMAAGEGPFEYESKDPLIAEVMAIRGINLQTDTKLVFHPTKMVADNQPFMESITLKVTDFNSGEKVLFIRHEDGTTALIRIRQKGKQ